MRRFLYLFLSLVAIHSVFSQECGTEVTEENIAFMKSIQTLRSRGVSTLASTEVTIPIKFHTIMTSSGDGGLTTTQINSIISRLNALYSNANMQFEHEGEVNIIVDDDNYNLDSSNEGAVASANDISGVINIYFSGSLSSGNLPLCGYTRFPPSSDRVFTTYGCTLNGTTLEHELGHYFTLFHTHGKTNTGTTDELVDGSNCTTAGDNICDTPADPNLSGMVNSNNCSYVGSATDANGDPYEPDPSNIMAYSLDACQDMFTAGQYDRVREGFENGRFYLKFKTDGFTAKFTADDPSTCIGSQVSFDGDAFGATSYEWTFEGGTPSSSTAEDPVVTYNQSGIFGVTLTVTNSQGETSTLSRATFVSITDPLANTLIDPYFSSVDSGIPSDFTIENEDRALTFEYRGDVDSEGNASSGSFWIDNHGYSTELNRNIDFLILRNYNTDGIKSFSISFDLAYTFRPIDIENDIPAKYDTLELILASQCGSKEIEIWQQGGAELATADPILSSFVPSDGSEWSSRTIKYEVPEELEFARFAFRNISKNGNNLFIDNISVEPDYTVDDPIDFRLSKVENQVATIRWFDGSTNETSYVLERSVNGSEFTEYKRLENNTIFYRDTLEAGNSYSYRLYADGVKGNRSNYTETVVISEDMVLSVNTNDNVTVFPNPSENVVTIAGLNYEYYYQVTDVSGKSHLAGYLTDSQNTINVSGLKSGIYFLRMKNNEIEVTKRFIKR